MSTRDAVDLLIAVDLLKSASAILTQYRELTNRPPMDDLTLYEWAKTDYGNRDAARVLTRAIEQYVYLWDPATIGNDTHVIQAEMDRACTVISQIMDDDDYEEED